MSKIKKTYDPSFVHIDAVGCLEDYVFELARLCVSVSTLVSLQNKAEAIGIFDDDETNASIALRDACMKMYTKCDDLLNMCSNRIGGDWQSKVIDSRKRKHMDTVKKSTSSKDVSKKTKKINK